MYESNAYASYNRFGKKSLPRSYWRYLTISLTPETTKSHAYAHLEDKSVEQSNNKHCVADDKFKKPKQKISADPDDSIFEDHNVACLIFRHLETLGSPACAEKA